MIVQSGPPALRSVESLAESGQLNMIRGGCDHSEEVVAEEKLRPLLASSDGLGTAHSIRAQFQNIEARRYMYLAHLN